MRSSVAALFILTVLAAGCSQHVQPRLVSSRPPAAAPSSASAIPGRPAAAVWNLRAGLNVAALSCKGRGRVPVRGPFGQVLSRQRALLAAAYSAEQHRQGGNFDRFQTRLYNRFSNQRQPAQFCRDAASVTRRATAMDSPTLALNAGSLLRELR